MKTLKAFISYFSLFVWDQDGKGLAVAHEIFTDQ